MIKAISIYPSNEDNYLNKCEEYISLASTYNFTSVFTSLHIPEINLKIQIKFLNELSKLCKKYNMEIIADIGGNSIKQIISDNELLNIVVDSNIDYLRLDYGYDHSDIAHLRKLLNNKGFIINASIYNEEESKQEVEFIRSLNCDIKACHNYYPRVESGIDESFALIQKQIFDNLNVPIYYYVPNINNPRGPVYKGLPTIEKHRNIGVKDALLELVLKYNADGIIISDNFCTKEYFDNFNNINLEKELIIKVKTINNKYDDIVYQTHIFRYDSNENYLRSKSSRQMAEYAKEIEPENCIDRIAGAITIDNKNYSRYSGELQVVLKNNHKDDRVNVVGYIEEKDLDKLSYYKQGYKFKFIKYDE